MNERKILAKIEELMQEQTALYAKWNEVYQTKPLGWKIRCAVINRMIRNIAGEIAAWKARLTVR